MRFQFVDPHSTGLPIYGADGAGVTYLWRAYPRQQAGYYTAFFWGNETFEWDGGTANTYYGFHPYPQPPPNGTDHAWEISVEWTDYVNGTVVYDQWFKQCARVWGASGAQKNHHFYWNLPNVDSGNKVVRVSPTTYGNTVPPTPLLTWGDASWNAGNEVWDGVLRGIQVYNVLLTEAQVLALSVVETNAAVLAKCAELEIGAPWYLNMNPTPTDISDKSGNGHHPSWVGANRPTLWTP